MHSSSPHLRDLLSLLFFAFLSFLAGVVWGEQVVVAGQTITSPLCEQTCGQAAANFEHLRRQDLGSTNCSYGICAGTCLDQGAFCCNPGGTTFSPICELPPADSDAALFFF